MEDSAQNQNQNQLETPPAEKYNFEEDLKRQNIHTMLEIYGEEYVAKIESLTR